MSWCQDRRYHGAHVAADVCRSRHRVEGYVMAFDTSVVGSTRHVVWQRLTTAEQADLLANYPLHPSITPPGPDVCGDDVNPRFEAWLDAAYLTRHATDSIDDDPMSS